MCVPRWHGECYSRLYVKFGRSCLRFLRLETSCRLMRIGFLLLLAGFILSGFRSSSILEGLGFSKNTVRERKRVDDILHKIAKQLADQTNIFEGLTNFKEGVAKTRSRSVNRQNSKHNYIKLQKYVEYKSA